MEDTVGTDGVTGSHGGPTLLPDRWRLVASDMDGSLLGADGAVSRRTIEAVRNLHAHGIGFVAATGRSHRTALPLLEPVGVVSHAVCSNGATIYDLLAGEIVVQHPIPAETVDALVSAVRAVHPGVGFAYETLPGFVWDPVFIAHQPPVDPARTGHPRPTIPPDAPVLKLMVSHPELEREHLLDDLTDVLDAHAVAGSTSGARFVEVTAEGVDKAFGLGVLCDRLGVGPGEVVAFGDHINDLPMLRWAGRGVVMGNAHPRVLAEATEVTLANTEDGVAHVLEQLPAPGRAFGPDGSVGRGGPGG